MGKAQLVPPNVPHLYPSENVGSPVVPAVHVLDPRPITSIPGPLPVYQSNVGDPSLFCPAATLIDLGVPAGPYDLNPYQVEVDVVPLVILQGSF